ncbi:PAC2 family-domain-containing protein [Thelephora terrestris]|uniref:Proteasome assembly chaperone 2 n=1 Tax=Thelephora terrestris TaxID=56493 RepID=A0A9P6HCV0_9AGAM|nr:PAC2 family-domain-containing protein [Thelephora terrestris]
MHHQFYSPSEGNLKGKLLIVPVVSTANIGQLAVDLLISSLDLHRIGIFDPRDLVPVVAAREDDEPGITTPLELYGSQDANFVVIQQRSPALKSRKDEFISDLHRFIQTSEFSAVIFLSGVDTSSRTDEQMAVPTYKLVPPGTPSWDSSPLAIVAHLPLPTYTYISQQPFPLLREGGTTEAVPLIPGGGLTRRILSSFPQQWSTPVLSLLQFVFEGDNQADAQLLASVVCKLLDVSLTRNGAREIEWKHPKSWNGGLFGTPHDQTLYG